MNEEPKETIGRQCVRRWEAKQQWIKSLKKKKNDQNRSPDNQQNTHQIPEPSV